MKHRPAVSGGVMRRGAAPVRAALVLVLLAVAAGAGSRAAGAGDSAGTPVAARALVAKLATSGRAEASLTRRFEDPLRDTTVVVHGDLVLEPPDRARLAFDETGEKITLRADGGEWLQPRLHQLMRFDAAHAMGALRWWTLFGGAPAAGWTERRTGERTWTVTLPGSGVAGDSARVTLDAEGLPARIVIAENGGAPVEYDLGHWRFTKPRGRRAFVIRPPAGVEVFDLR